ncbi:MAG: hypothetical protein AAB861_03335 [Patescibacteria group bacterium]
MSESIVAPYHTLLSRDIRPIRNWCEWLQRWQAAESFEEMLGLLHCGFNVSLERGEYGEKEHNQIGRLTFYFTIAAGWEDYILLRSPADGNRSYDLGRDASGNRVTKTTSELRQQLARKAFDILCLNFFKNYLEEDRDRENWMWKWVAIAVSEQLFPVIQSFFRAEKRQYGGISIRNLSRSRKKSHGEQTAVDFLFNLANFIWDWREQEIRSYYSRKEELERENVSMRARVDAAKPWIVELLSWLDNLNLLRKRISELDETCLAKLKEIAMRAEIDNPSSTEFCNRKRLVVSLDEACYVGSKAAWFLKEHELWLREHTRLEAIRKAEERKRGAERELQKLTAK